MIGRCALCGEEKELSFEHIPPESCFNNLPVKSVSGSIILQSISNDKRKPWELSGLKYQNMQRGMGKWSLCTDCNSKTGRWYGKDYSKFAHSLNNLLIENNVDAVGRISIKAFDAYPLRIIKQMLSMICSINSKMFDDIRIKTLAEFVLSKNMTGLNKSEYRVYFFIARNYIAKLCPLTTLTRNVVEPTNFATDVISEIFVYPIGIVVCFNPRPDFSHFGADITEFCDIGYYEMCQLELTVPVLESYNVLPCDYRSMEEFEGNYISDNDMNRD